MAGIQANFNSWFFSCSNQIFLLLISWLPSVKVVLGLPQHLQHNHSPVQIQLLVTDQDPLLQPNNPWVQGITLTAITTMVLHLDQMDITVPLPAAVSTTMEAQQHLSLTKLEMNSISTDLEMKIPADLITCLLAKEVDTLALEILQCNNQETKHWM